MSDLGTGAQALTALNELVIALNAIAQVVAGLASVAPVPASASAAGTAGAVAISADFLYVCVATDTWKRVALATW